MLPTATDAAWDHVTVTCAPLAGDRFGANLVPCTATDGSGNATGATITVDLLQPLAVEVLAPLSQTAINGFTVGQTLPHKVRLLDCTRTNVTTSAPVSVRLAVTAGLDGTGANLVNDASDYSLIGDPTGVMTLVDGHYHFDLTANPVDYAPGGRSYLSTMTAAYDVAPSLAAGQATARLQSK